MRLSIKGNKEQSEKAILDHGITGAKFSSTANEGKVFAQSFWDVSEDFRVAVINWFCEPAESDDTGFPIGTLLFHN